VFISHISSSGLVSSGITAHRLIAGTVNASGTTAKRFGRSLAGAISSSALLRNAPGIRFIASVASGGSVIARKTIVRNFIASISSSGLIRKKASARLAGIESPTGAIRKAPTKRLQGAVTALGALINLFYPTPVPVEGVIEISSRVPVTMSIEDSETVDIDTIDDINITMEIKSITSPEITQLDDYNITIEINALVTGDIIFSGL
jgi:hypothetical protein